MADEAGRGARDADRERRCDDAIVAGLRAGDRRAYQEFYERLAPALFEHARRLAVAREDRWVVVTELLDDLVLRLTRLRTPVRKSLEDLAVVALRRRLITERRTRDRRRRLEGDAATALGAGGESVVASTCSAASMRAAGDPLLPTLTLDAHPAAAGGEEAVRALGLALLRQLAPEEVRLLEWVAERVPQREMAAWLGTTHGAVRVRISRLRARLRDAARRHQAALDGAERDAVARFLERATGEPTARTPSTQAPAPHGRDPRDDEAA